MSGYVGRETLDLTENGKKTYQFIQNKRGGQYKVFKTRSLAIDYCLHKMHMTQDDIRFLFWYDDKEEELRRLHTGEYVEGFREIEGKIYAYNFWMCEDCKTVYRASKNPECHLCGMFYRFNVLLEDIPYEMLNREERDEIKIKYKWFKF